MDAKLVRLLDLYRDLFQQSNEAVVLLKDTPIIECNPRVCELFKRSRKEIIGREPWDFAPQYQPDERASAQAGRARVEAALSGIPQLFEWLHQEPGGELIQTEVSLWCIHQEQRLVIGIIRDITRRRQLESQLRHAQKLEALGTLGRGIAHDFNNVLGVISGYSELLMEELAGNSKAESGLSQIMRACRRAGDMVKQILMFSRSEDGERVSLMLHLVVKEALKLIRSSLPADVILIPRIQVHDVRILADVSQIHQMVVNLCANAVQAMPDGGNLTVTLDVLTVDSENVSSHEGLSPGEYARIVVKDTGHGMEKRVRERVFDPYFSTRDSGGGMGLPVVMGIVRGHGGDVKIDSVLDEGTTVQVFLPTLSVEIQDEHIDYSDTSGCSERILLVDDEVSLVELASRMLKRLGYKVTPFTSSKGALEAFRSAPDDFDLVITDQTMPDLTGVQLVKELRKIRSDLSIILCTGFSEAIGRDNYEFLGVNAFISKPILMKELARTIRQTLDR